MTPKKFVSQLGNDQLTYAWEEADQYSPSWYSRRRFDIKQKTTNRSVLTGGDPRYVKQSLVPLLIKAA